LGFDHSYQNQQKTLSFGLGEANAARIQAQNQRKISVIIGNPPYNANQQNENDNNKNRPYDEIDESIKRTYIANSTAQKTKLYDMYARFFRWASNRLSDNGILAFITNSSFIDARGFDGFRKVVAEEFDAIYVLDLGGNIRKGSKSNVFGIKVGVAISFLIKDANQLSKSCQIFYAGIPEFNTATEKLTFLRTSQFHQINFKRIIPSETHDWINQSNNDFDSLLSLADKKTKLATYQKNEQSIFKLFSLGVVTNRDEWVYDIDANNLEQKITYFVNIYTKTILDCIGKVNQETINEFLEGIDIKWTRAVKNDLREGKQYFFDRKSIVESLYRPFVKKKLYFKKELNEMQYQLPKIFLNGRENLVICFTDTGSEKPFLTLVSNKIPDLHLSSPGCGTQCLALYCYDSKGNRLDNITDWGLNQFRSHYQDNSITKENIFHYTYAVLHHPAYRDKYALNLKREFPRLPFYEDFPQWVDWGKQLMDLHLNYETVEKYPLKRIDQKLASNIQNKPKLKADKEAGNILIDVMTTLQGVPVEAWEYKLGNRSALEWILDQYKEKKPKDKTIAEKFNTYRFTDYKESVIELLQRVCTVSVETVRIILMMNCEL
jgi:predicted helicase